MTTPCIGRISYGYESTYTGPDILSPDLRKVILPPSKSIKLTSHPKYDEAGHTPKYIEHVLEYEGTLYDANLDNLNIVQVCKSIRSILLQEGLNLFIPEVGIGLTGLFTYGKDARRGPYPQEVIVEPYVNNQAILIKFTILFTTHNLRVNITADGTLNNKTTISSVSRQLNLNIDEEGDVILQGETTVTFTAPIISNDISSLIEQIRNFTFVESLPPLIKGFRYEEGNTYQKDLFTLVMTFSLKEIKHDNALYPGTKEIQAEHEVSSSLFGDDPFQGAGFRTWLNRLSGTITLGPYTPKVYAFYIAQLIVRNRLLRLQLFTSKNVQETTQSIGGTLPDGLNGKYIPLRIMLKESIYGRQVDFEFEWMHTSDLDNLIYSSGLFRRVNTSYGTYDTSIPEEIRNAPGVVLGETTTNQPLPLNKQWTLWQHSTKDWITQQFAPGKGILPIRVNQMDSYLGWRLFNNPNNPNNRFAPEEAANSTLIPLYGNTNPIFSHKYTLQEALNNDYNFSLSQSQNVGDWAPSSSSQPGFYNNVSLSQNLPFNQYIEPEYSWLEYKPEYEIIEEAGSIPIDYLEDTGKTFYADSTPASSYLLADRFRTINQANQTITAPAEIVARNYSRIYVRFTGHALRVGHQIPMPSIVSIGGVPAYRVGKPRWKHVEVQSASEYPTYLAMWDIMYTIDGQIPTQNILSSIQQMGTPSQVT